MPKESEIKPPSQTNISFLANKKTKKLCWQYLCIEMVEHDMGGLLKKGGIWLVAHVSVQHHLIFWEFEPLMIVTILISSLRFEPKLTWSRWGGRPGGFNPLTSGLLKSGETCMCVCVSLALGKGTHCFYLHLGPFCLCVKIGALWP